MRMAGERGFAPYAHCLVPGNVVADLFQTYEKGAASAGRSVVRTEFRLARSIFVADTTTEAEQIVRSNSLGKNYEYIGLLFDKGIGRKIYKRDLDMPDSECGLEYLMTEQIIAGDVDQVVKRLLAVYEECGGFGILNMMSYDWDDKQRWVRSMELFSREVMPALNKAVGA
jgi:alkanesulfonate monooxygenase SsuD/methylene tetrahydromethanopterin reductase-like flavin-dependent oxidoreductase (luciferase family)